MTANSPTEVRKKLRDDFEFYAKHCVKIRTKEGEIRTLELNPVQKKFNAIVEAQLKTTGKVRVIILKARQQGLSTFVSAWKYWHLSHRKAKKGLVVAHVADSTKALFDMYKRIHAECPDAVRPSTKYSSRRELVFDKLDTGLMVATAGGDAIARGETLSHAHLSEVAFWPKSTAADNLNALSQAIPNTKDTAVFIESTANGMSGPFHDLWQAAVEGTVDYIPFFSPWFDSPEYTEEPPDDYERTYEEQDIAEEYGLTDGQLWWRRRKVAQNGLDAFKQEYPSNPEEAFLASGRPVFNPEQINAILKKAPEPIRRMAVENGVLRDHPRGELAVYAEVKTGEPYYIGADIGMGIKGGDYSVAQILDSNRNQVGVWRGICHPDFFADILEALGYHYNTALIAPENNAHGLLTAVRLGRDKAYPSIYTEVSEGKLNDRESISIGFRTTSKTKPLIIDHLREQMREGGIKVHDKTTLREMLTYIVTESGSMEAEDDTHDDCVMSLAIANHINEGDISPIDVTSDYYVEAI